VADTNGDEIARRLADVLIRRLFAVGLDLHGALAHIDPGDVAAQKVHSAVRGLDIAIKDFRSVIFDFGQAPLTSGVRTLVVDAVERACEHAGGSSPTIVFGQGVDAVSEQATSQQVARLIHEVLTRVPDDRLSAARVEVIADSRPPPRLVAHIDIPGNDAADVACRAETAGVDVSWHALATSPAISRIRVECRPAGS
jgi:Histidine kinase